MIKRFNNLEIAAIILFCLLVIAIVDYKLDNPHKCQGVKKWLHCSSIEGYDTRSRDVDTHASVPWELRNDIQNSLSEVRENKGLHVSTEGPFYKETPEHKAKHLNFLKSAHTLDALRTHANSYIMGHSASDFVKIKSNLSPLDQFLIKDFLSFYFNIGFNIKFLFTNMSFYLVIITLIAFILNVIYNKLNTLVSNFWSLNKESLYATIHGVVTNQIDVIKGQNFLPFIYTIFIFIFISNLVGMIPYNFSPTSHFILTFFISFTIVVGSTILGFTSFKTKFFSILVPSGCPTGLLPLLVLIETISYLARNVSLGLRLAANILSGHMLLNILSGFTYNIMASGFIFFIVGLIPLTFITAFSTLEMGICFIQAQVFSVLSSSYIKDGIILH